MRWIKPEKAMSDLTKSASAVRRRPDDPAILFEKDKEQIERSFALRFAEFQTWKDLRRMPANFLLVARRCKRQQPIERRSPPARTFAMSIASRLAARLRPWRRQ